MPAAAQFTPLFVESFIRRCYDAGITKEATVYLLELSALKAAHEQPGFAAGFNERMASGPLEKSAWARAGKLIAGAAGMGALGYGGYKAHEATIRRNRQPWPDVPQIGGYSATGAADNYRHQLSAASEGIGQLNAEVDRVGRRRAELEDVVAEGQDADKAIGELQALRKSPYPSQRDAYGRELDRYNQGVNENLGVARRDLADLNASRGSWWNRARAFVGMPRDFDDEERNLVGRTARLAEQARLSAQLRERLRSGATGFDDRAPVPQETLESRFFQTR
jgi:hypothetical protein